MTIVNYDTPPLLWEETRESDAAELRRTQPKGMGANAEEAMACNYAYGLQLMLMACKSWGSHIFMSPLPRWHQA